MNRSPAFEALPVSREDLPAVRRIERYCFYPASMRTRRYYARKLLLRSLLKAVSCDQIVGYAGFVRHRRYLDVSELAVSLDCRRQGAATALLGHLAFVALGMGIGTVHLTVDTMNDPALSLYRKLGFTPQKLRRGYYGSGDGLVMIAPSREIIARTAS